MYRLHESGNVRSEWERQKKTERYRERAEKETRREEKNISENGIPAQTPSVKWTDILAIKLQRAFRQV